MLALPGNNSLKGKRKVIRSALDRVRARFNAAAAEVDYLDDWRRAGLAFSVVSNDHSHANSMLDSIAGFVSTSVDAVVVDRSLEIIPLGHMSPLGEDWGES